MLFYLYVLLNLFIGNSIASFLGVSHETDSILFSIHWRTLPILLLLVLTSQRKIRFSRQEIGLFLLCAFSLVVSQLVDRSAMLAVTINIAVEPAILIAYLRALQGKHSDKVKKALIVFFLIECVTAWIEVATRTILFADLSNMKSENLNFMLSEEMRAYSLHGHPLQNAFIVSILSFFFLTANGSTLARYGLFAIGYISLMAFNTRSSIYLMGGVFILVLLKDLRGGRVKKSQKWLIMSLLCIALAAIGYLMREYEFGSRLVYSLSSSDDSSNVRYMLVGIILGMPISNLLWGMKNGVEIITSQYDFFAIENSLANFIVTNGVIYTILWCILIYLCLRSINPDKRRFKFSFLVFFVLLNANNSLMTDAPIIIIYILALYSLKSIGIKKVDILQRKNSSPR